MNAYETGLDILGIIGVARQQFSTIQSKMDRGKKAAAQMLSHASNVGSYSPKAANALRKMAAGITGKASKAASAATKARQLATARTAQRPMASASSAAANLAAARPDAAVAAKPAAPAISAAAPKPVSSVMSRPSSALLSAMARPMSAGASTTSRGTRLYGDVTAPSAASLFKSITQPAAPAAPGSTDTSAAEDTAAAAAWDFSDADQDTWDAINNLMPKMQEMGRDLSFINPQFRLSAGAKSYIPGSPNLSTAADSGDVVVEAPPAASGTSRSSAGAGAGARGLRASDIFGLISADQSAVLADGQALWSEIEQRLTADSMNAGAGAAAQPYVDLLNRAVTWLGRAQPYLSGSAVNPAYAAAAAAAAGTPGVAGPWQPNTAYALNTEVTSGGNSYFAIQAGTSGTVAPSGTGQSIADGTVLWAYLGAAQTGLDAGAGYGGYGGGGGGGGDDEGGGGYEEEAPMPGDEMMPATGEGGYDPFADEVPATEEEGAFDEGDLASEYQEPVDPFAEEGAGESEDEMLGIDFKWQYLFAPWNAIEDYYNERQATHNVVASPETSATLDYKKPRVLSAQEQQRQDYARRRLAEQSSRTLPVASRPTPPTYDVTSPSETLMDRLQATKAFLASAAIEGDMSSEESFLEEENPDIDVEPWTQDITDEPADPTRRTASLHYGAAYLQERSYPRYGASSGQEGGLMFPRETIHINGEEIACDDYQKGADVLGAGPVRASTLGPRARVADAKKTAGEFRLKATPGGGNVVTYTPRAGRKGDLKKTIANAKTAAKRAVSVGGKLVSAVKAGKVKTTAAAPKTGLRGLVEDVLFGAPAPLRNVASRGRGVLRLSPAQLKKLGETTVKSGHELATAATKLQKVQDKKDKAARASRVIARPGGGRTAVRGEGTDPIEIILGLEALNAEADVLCEEIVGDAYVAAVEDAVVAGQMVTYSTSPLGTPAVPPAGGAMMPPGYTDPSMADPYAADAGTAPAYDPNETLQLLADPNVGEGPMPTRETVEYVENQDYQKGPGLEADWKAGLPDGAIVLEGFSPSAKESVASRAFFAQNGNGFWWQGAHWNGRWQDWDGEITDWGGGTGSGDTGGSSHTDASSRARAWLQANGGWPPSWKEDPKLIDGASRAAGWGGLVGNPNKAEYKGLRFDSATGQWYWFFNEAPKDKQEERMNEVLAQQVAEWRTRVATKKTELAAQALEDQTDADYARQVSKQTAAEDAALAHQQEIEAKQAEHDAEIQAKADEAAERQQAMADAAAREQMERDVMAERSVQEGELAKSQQEFEQSQAAWQAVADMAAQGAQSPAEAEEAAEAMLPGGDVSQPDDFLPGMEDELPEHSDEPFDTGEFNLESETMEGVGDAKPWLDGVAYKKGDTASYDGEDWYATVDYPSQHPGAWFSSDWKRF